MPNHELPNSANVVAVRDDALEICVQMQRLCMK